MDRKIGLLKGNKTHLSIIPKLGSSAIRNLYSRDSPHSDSTHDEIRIELLNPNDKIIVFLKPQKEIFMSAIQTDFRASVRLTGHPPNFPTYRNSIYTMDENKKDIWMNLIETFTPYKLSSEWLSKEWGDKKEFFDFATHVIETAFSLKNDISWMVTGHFSDSFNILPEILKKDNVLITDISSLSNPKFINWLKKEDSGWKHLNEDVICNTPKRWDGTYSDENKWNISPPNSCIIYWVEYVAKIKKKPYKHFFRFKNFSATEFKYNTKDKETNVIQSNDTLLYTLHQEFELTDTLYMYLKESSKYLKF